MKQTRIAYTLACALAVACTSAPALAQTATPALPYAPCFAPNLQTARKVDRGDEFLRALGRMKLSDAESAQVTSLATAYCGTLSRLTDTDAMRAAEVQFHDDLMGLLLPEQRAELNDTVAQIRTDEIAQERLAQTGE